jgi:putative ABC transport system ATP-binding protein
MNSAISVTGVHKTYNGTSAPTHALRGVDLEVQRGSFTCLVGPSGHGKSTLLHLLGGLDRAEKGGVEVLGLNLSTSSDTRLARFRAERVGFVFQFFNLLSGLSVAENVQLPMMLRGATATAQKSRAHELLDIVGLRHKAEARPNELSGGQMQRVAIARALANDPELLLLDEPTGNLDSASETEVISILLDLHAQGRTIVMVTHSTEIAQKAERVVRVVDGRIVA